MKIRKYLITLFLVFGSSQQLFAADDIDPYDGIWVITGEFNQGDFHFVRQKGSEIVIGNLWGKLDGWDALYGQIQDNKAQLETLITPDAGEKVIISVDFTSDTAATLTVNSCNDCGFPLNVPMSLEKIF